MSVIDLPKLLTDRQAAEVLNVKPQTLAAWRCNGRHDLRFIRVGRAIRYRLDDLQRWIDGNAVGGADQD